MANCDETMVTLMTTVKEINKPMWSPIQTPNKIDGTSQRFSWFSNIEFMGA